MVADYTNSPPTSQELYSFYKNRQINPRTNTIIQDNSVFKYLCDTLQSFFFTPINSGKVDPILLEPVPRKRGKPIFTYPWKWDYITGERIHQLEPDGGLFFDPDTLIHYFYTNRLKQLWFYSDDDYEPMYGDAMGNGPEFYIKGRGYHPDWYLFRLPLIYKNLPKDFSLQIPTVMPALSDQDIELIDSMAEKYGGSYKRRFGIKRPKLKKIKKLYDIAIDPFPDIELSAKKAKNEPDKAELERRNRNRHAINELRYL